MMSSFPVLLAYDVDIEHVVAPWRSISPSTLSGLIVVGAIGLVTLLVLVWAIFFRKRDGGGGCTVTRTIMHPPLPNHLRIAWRTRRFLPRGKNVARDGIPGADAVPATQLLPKPGDCRRFAPTNCPDRGSDHASEPDDHAEKRVKSGTGFRALAQGQTR